MSVNILNFGTASIGSFNKLWENPDIGKVTSDSYIFPAQTVSHSGKYSFNTLNDLYMWLITFYDKKTYSSYQYAFLPFLCLSERILQPQNSAAVDLKTNNVFRGFDYDFTNKISFGDCKETSNGVTTINNGRIIPIAVHAVPATFFDLTVT